MKNTVLIALVALLLGFNSSCKKKDSTPPSTTPQNFQPVSAGSTWTYATVSNGVSGSYTITATGNDSTINGKVYKIFTNSAGPNEYYYKTGND